MARVVLFFMLCPIFILLNEAFAEQTLLSTYCVDRKGNYTNNSTYEANLNHLLSILPSEPGNGYGFYNLSYGSSPNQVYAIGLCRGDARPQVCRDCLNNTAVLIPKRCPNRKEALEWYEYCMLRYSNRSMFGLLETSETVFIFNDNNVSSNVEEFTSNLTSLLRDLKIQAASGGPLRKYATGDTSAPDFKTIYALVQCTPDLSQRDCNNCLDQMFQKITEFNGMKIELTVISTNCNFRYDTELFYDTTYEPPSFPPALPPTLSPPSPPSPTGGGESNTSRIIIIAVASSTLAFLILIISICVVLRIKRANKKEETRPLYESDEEIESPESLQYNFENIRVATNDFSEANKLGQGGFGSVYQGRLSNGQDIAVKRLARGSSQGDLEFKNEVILVAKLQHRNLVRLLGFSFEGNERLLVYEFVPNASLDHFIFDPSKRANLDWERRYKIIEGISRGILYLHEDSRLRIIHRDLKASNILLDAEMNPKISDFGMARLFVVDQNQGNTSRIVGTYGYMAPEYAFHGQFSVKSDVYSFGVLLLEIVSGVKNNNLHHEDTVEDLLSYAWRNWREGRTLNVADPLMRLSSGSEITRCIHIALLCVQKNVADRPTMNAIVLMLSSNSLSLPVPSVPAFLTHCNIGSDMSLSADPKSEASANEASITEPYPR